MKTEQFIFLTIILIFGFLVVCLLLRNILLHIKINNIHSESIRDSVSKLYLFMLDEKIKSNEEKIKNIQKMPDK